MQQGWLISAMSRAPPHSRASPTPGHPAHASFSLHVTPPGASQPVGFMPLPPHPPPHDSAASLHAGGGVVTHARPMQRSASFGSFDGSSRVLTARELLSYERSDGLTMERSYDDDAGAGATGHASASGAGAAARKRPVLLSTPRKVDSGLSDRSPIPVSIHTIPLDSIAVPQWRMAAERQQHQRAHGLRMQGVLSGIPPVVTEEDSGSNEHKHKSSNGGPETPSPSPPVAADAAAGSPVALARRASLAVFQSLAVHQLAQEGAAEVGLQEWIPRLLESLAGVHAPAPLDLRGANASNLLQQWVSVTLNVQSDNLLAVQVVAPPGSAGGSSSPDVTSSPVDTPNAPHYSGDAVSLLIDTSLAPPKLVGVVKVFSSDRSFEQELIALGRMHAWIDPPESAVAAAAGEENGGADASASSAASHSAVTTSTTAHAGILRVPKALGAHFALTPAGKGGVLVMSPADGLPLDDLFVSLSRAPLLQTSSQSTPISPERSEHLQQLSEGLRAAALAFFELHTHPKGSGGKVRKKFIQRFVSQLDDILARMKEHIGEPPSSAHGAATEASSAWARFPKHHHLLDIASLQVRLQPLIAAALSSRGRACVVHGDAHLGNVFFDRSTGLVTLIDVPSVNQSVGERGEPIGCAARDVANLYQKIHVAASKQHCSPSETQQLQSLFLDSYQRHYAAAGVPCALSMESFHLFHLRSLLGELHRTLAFSPDALVLESLHAVDHGLLDAELHLSRRKQEQSAEHAPLHPRSARRPGDGGLSDDARTTLYSGDDDDVRDDAVALQMLDEERQQELLADEEIRKTELARQEMREQDAMEGGGPVGMGIDADEDKDIFDDDEEELAMAAAGFQRGATLPHAQLASEHAAFYTMSPIGPQGHTASVQFMPSLGLPGVDSFPPTSRTHSMALHPASSCMQHSAATPVPSPPHHPSYGFPSVGTAAGNIPSALPPQAAGPGVLLPSLSINGGRILVVLGAPLKADQCTPDVWLESRLKQSVSLFYRVQAGLSALLLSGGRTPGQEVSVAKVMERWLRPFGIRSNSSRFLLLNEDMSSCGSAESYPRDLISQAFCIRSMLRVRGFRHGNLLICCSDFQLASVAMVFNRIFRSSTGLVQLEYSAAPTVRAYAPSSGVEAARLKELPSLMKEMRTTYVSFFPYGRCSLLDACRAGSLQSLRAMVEQNPGAVNSEKDPLGCSSLHIAAECGFTDCCEYLLRAGADPNARSTLGATPLHYGTAMGRLDVVELLLDFGAGPSRLVKGGCGRGCWLGSRRPCDMHKFGPSPLSVQALSTHQLQESQPSWSVITLLVQPESVSLAEATEDVRREHELDATRRRRAVMAMHRSASSNALNRSRQSSLDAGSQASAIGDIAALASVDANGRTATDSTPATSAPTSPLARAQPTASEVTASTPPLAPVASVPDGPLSASDLHRFASGTLSNVLSSYPNLASKRVLLLRHSESLWNVNGSHRVRGLIDTTLTNTGVRQAKQLQGLLQRTGALQRMGVRLIVVSPLTRTLQTYMLSVRWYLDLFPSPSAAAHASPPPPGSLTPPTGAMNAAPSTSSAASASSSSCPVRVVVNASLAEQLLSTGTIGRSPEQLAKDFQDPSLDFAHLPPVWWYAPAKDDVSTSADGASASPTSPPPASAAACPGPPPANVKIFLRKEPVANLRARIHTFLSWLCAQPESSVLLVGHGTYFREMVDEEHLWPDVFKSNLSVYVVAPGRAP